MSDYNSLKNSALTSPTGNLDLGSATNRYGNIFLQGNLAIGNLVANESSLVSPKISSLTYVGDDTAANPAGGQTITVNGSGFATGAVVYVAGSVVSLTVVVSPSAITFTSPAKAAGNYTLILVNLDGGTATFIPGMQYSGVPTWSTSAGSLANVYESASVSSTLVATSDSTVSYSVTSGALPAGVTLNSATGIVAGTAPAVASGSGTYSFTANAKDGENQDTPRNFSITVNADAVTWSSPADNTTVAPTVGSIFVQALSATSAAGKTITYSANSLPSGLSIVGTNITGTPTTAGNVTSLITATAATTGKTANITLNLNTPSFMSATGGTVTTSGSYKIHTFNTSGTFSVSTAGSMEYVVVAGGGGGGDYYAGGGGGGGMQASTATASAGNYTVTIGAGGGWGGGAGSAGLTGAASSISGTGVSVSAGGGLGGGGINQVSGYPAAGGSDMAGGPSGTPQSNAGGASVKNVGGSYFSGGGGGAGAVGVAGSNTVAPEGGIGAASSITGSSILYGGGGGGGSGSNPFVWGRGAPFTLDIGGGGAGGGADHPAPDIYGYQGAPGIANLGGGGGGAGPNGSGGSGGSGVVIIRYQYQ